MTLVEKHSAERRDGARRMILEEEEEVSDEELRV